MNVHKRSELPDYINMHRSDAKARNRQEPTSPPYTSNDSATRKTQ